MVIHRGTKLEDWLRTWAAGSTEEPSEVAKSRLYNLLSPHLPSPHEANRVRAALLHGEDGRRRRLIERFDMVSHEISPTNVRAQILGKLPKEQAAQIEAAWRFRSVLSSAQEVVRQAASTLNAHGMRRQLSGLAAKECSGAIEAAQSRARSFLDHLASKPGLGHPEAGAFAKELAEETPLEALASVLHRSNRLLEISGGAVSRGPAFTDTWARIRSGDTEVSLDDEIDDGLPPRFWELASVLNDCKAAG